MRIHASSPLVALALCAALVCAGCAPSVKKEPAGPEFALSRVRLLYPSVEDDMDLDSLALAVKRNLEYLSRIDPESVFQYGPHRYTCRQVRKTQEAFLELIMSGPAPRTLAREIRKRFLFYRATGRAGDEDVLFTGYFEPVFDARLTADETFKYPLYRTPDDMVTIDLAPFNTRFKGQSITARIDGGKVLPYYSRHDIEEGRVLEGRGLEIAWLKDPVDVAFLHIQGSGRLRLPDGRTVQVGYHAKNGRPYRSIGKYLIDKGLLERETISMQAIRRYLSRHPEHVDTVLDHKPFPTYSSGSFRLRRWAP